MDTRVLKLLADDWPEAAVVRSFTPPNPAAGADFTVTVPGEACWAVFSITATLTTSVAVANRVPVFRITDGTNTLQRYPSPANITASLTTLISLLPELGYTSSAITQNTLTFGLPPLYLVAGQQIAVTTALLDAADQWSGINVTVLEMYHGEREHERSIANAIVNHYEAVIDLVEGRL